MNRSRRSARALRHAAGARHRHRRRDSSRGVLPPASRSAACRCSSASSTRSRASASRSAPRASRWQLIVLGKRHLLWRVRRKLILSYVFIGFIPAVLIVVVLSAERLPAVLQLQLVPGAEPAARDRRSGAVSRAEHGDRNPAAGGRDAAAILARRQGNADDEYPGLSVAVVPVDRPCAAGSSPRRVAAPLPARDRRPDRGRTSRRRRRCRRGSAATGFSGAARVLERR